MKNKKNINFLQVNLNRNKSAQDLMLQTVRELNIDIVLGQEPNKSQSNNLICDKTCDTFIYINKTISVINIEKQKGFVSIELNNTVIYSCYISPNVDIDTFKSYLFTLHTSIGRHKKQIIVGGDFNAKFGYLNSAARGERGKYFDEWVSSCGLFIVNNGNTNTFNGPQGGSIIDATLMSINGNKVIQNWTVHEDMENLSDHRNITYCLLEAKTEEFTQIPQSGFKFTPTLWNNFHEKYKDGLFTEKTKAKITTPEQMTEELTKICEKAFPRKKPLGNNRKPMYWWNETIAKIRKECLKQRRKMVRINSTNISQNTKDEIKTKYKELKKKLNSEIRQSKRNAWKLLCEELENDIWGQAYKIINKKLNIQPRMALNEEQVKEQIKLLFPSGNEVFWEKVNKNEIKIFTESELLKAVSKTRNKKAAGLDQLTPEFLKAAIKLETELFLKIYNQCLLEREFPKCWKQAKLVLLKKPKKNETDDDTFRPICLLNTAGKILERLICTRLEEELEQKNILHPRQFGFRKGKSTLNALEEVLKIPEKVRNLNFQHQGYIVLVALDIKNAFNSAPWEQIINALEKAKVSDYLTDFIKSYLSCREIVVSSSFAASVTRGVPQGSILGPILWNIFYDQILRMEMERGVDLIAYADDLAVVVRGNTPEHLKERTEHAIKKIYWKLESMELKLAPHKSEVVILLGRRKLKDLSIKVIDTEIRSKNKLKYMGLTISRNTNMGTHLQDACQRATEDINTLQRILPRIGGPGTTKRRILVSASMSRLLYGAPIWGKILKYKKYKNMILSIGRKTALKIIGGYKTISTNAATAIAGTTPLDILVVERTRTYAEGKDSKTLAIEDGYNKWKERWGEYEGWTKTFIKDVRKWKERKFGEVDFYTTQAISGHGCFGTYLKKFGKAESSNCWFCGGEDSPEHTLFLCEQWSEDRAIATKKCNVSKIDKGNVAQLLLRDKGSWDAVMEMLRNIMRNKSNYELNIQKLNKIT